MQYELILHDTSKPNSIPVVVNSLTPFSPIAVGDRIIGQGGGLAIGVPYTIARIDHLFPSDEDGNCLHRLYIYLAP